MKFINPSTIPTPAGHYSPGVVSGNLLFVSGQLPVNTDGSHTADQSFDFQARQALHNLFAVLQEAGATPHNLVKINVYITDVKYWPLFNEIYSGIMGTHKPARAVIPIPELHHGYLIEIDAVAEIQP